MSTAQPKGRVPSVFPRAAGAAGGALLAIVTATAVGPNDRNWTGAAFGWAVVLLPFAIVALAARRWKFSMGRALGRCAMAFVATMLGLFVVSATLYAFFG